MATRTPEQTERVNMRHLTSIAAAPGGERRLMELFVMEDGLLWRKMVAKEFVEGFTPAQVTETIERLGDGMEPDSVRVSAEYEDSYGDISASLVVRGRRHATQAETVLWVDCNSRVQRQQLAAQADADERVLADLKQRRPELFMFTGND